MISGCLIEEGVKPLAGLAGVQAVHTHKLTSGNQMQWTRY
jgi:hypothetical protein